MAAQKNTRIVLLAIAILCEAGPELDICPYIRGTGSYASNVVKYCAISMRDIRLMDLCEGEHAVHSPTTMHILREIVASCFANSITFHSISIL